MNEIKVAITRKIVYECDKYCWPFHETIENGPQISVCISSRTFVATLASNLLMFVCFPFMQFVQISKSAKSRESRIPYDTSLSILLLENPI